MTMAKQYQEVWLKNYSNFMELRLGIPLVLKVGGQDPQGSCEKLCTTIFEFGTEWCHLEQGVVGGGKGDTWRRAEGE